VLDSAPPVEAPPFVRPILPLERLAALLEVILCSGFPTQLLVIAVVRGFGVPPLTPDGLLVPRFVILVSLIDAFLVIGLIVMLLKAHRESVRDVLIGRGRMLKEVALGLVLIPFVFVLVAIVLGVVLHYFPVLRNVPTNPLEGLLKTRHDAIVFAFVAMFSGGVREEVQRGFIVHRFEGFLGGGLIGVAVYSVLFGLGHFEQGWDATIATGCLGAIWGLVYWKRRSIIAPVVSHAGFNLAQIIKAMLLR
jgi:membrane protease YdiL (CAAX protease family)